MLKIKQGYLLKQLKGQSFVIPVNGMTKEFSGIIRLNETGTFYWTQLEKGSTREELLDLAMTRFEDADKEEVSKDLEEFLEGIGFALEKS